jgi:nucleolar MIF4G domain-containing protein 1
MYSTAAYTLTGTRYLPPHLRHTQRDNQYDSEDTIKLTRQLKGLLNRMSEQNMAGILVSIEEIYRKYRRNGKVPYSLS